MADKSQSFSLFPAGMEQKSLTRIQAISDQSGLTDDLTAASKKDRLDGRAQGPQLSGNGSDASDEPDEDMQLSQNIPLQHLSHTSQMNLVPRPTNTYQFKRYIARSTLNTLGPLLVTGIYAYTAFGHLLRPSVNNVVPYHFIDPKALFYTWIILSIFLLDWAKSGMAGFEAAALMKPRLAPSNAMQLMWHLDRGWGSPSGWWKAVSTTYNFVAKRARRGRHGEADRWHGPGLLWFYLAGSSLLFFIAVPLAGLSINSNNALKVGDRQIVVLGVNETTFDVQTNAAVSGLASNSWRTGRPTAPQEPTIFYAPEGIENVSSTHFEDSVMSIYNQDLLGQSVPNRTVTFFSGPPVAERAHGKAWGLLSSVECSASNIVHGLELIGNVTGSNNWTTRDGLSSSAYRLFSNDTTSQMYANTGAGLNPVIWFADSSYGIDFQYVIASDRDISGVGNGDYSNTNYSALPNRGLFEIVVWQSISKGFDPDDGFQNMTTSPLVTSFDNDTTLCYGVRCTVQSDVGFAELDAVKRTYSNFQQHAAQQGPGALSAIGEVLPIYQYPGIFAIQSIVFEALSTVSMAAIGPPLCLPGADPTCNAFYGANLATGGVPRIVRFFKSGKTGSALQVPSITPEIMTRAMYKIFGEAAAAMMAIGPSNWTGTLQGLEYANDLVPGNVPWQIVLALLCLWCGMTVIPQLWTFAEPRWSSTLEAFEMFRLGAEWKEVIQQFGSNDFRENDVLIEVPGLIGDITPQAETGFIGLSHVPARTNRKFSSMRDTS